MSVYTVEVTKSKHPKSGYKQRYSFDDSKLYKTIMPGKYGQNITAEEEARFYYACINIGNGYRCRLRKDGKTIKRKGYVIRDYFEA